MGLEGDGLAGLGVRRRRDGDWQQNLAGIAVIGQGASRLQLGRGPDDVAGFPAGRQGPGDLGGLAGIAGIAPVGVPALVDLLAQGDVIVWPGAIPAADGTSSASMWPVSTAAA